jgi:lipopolysaccharide/colanic/teichoic acid biosynthesis glycosyltransferase
MGVVFISESEPLEVSTSRLQQHFRRVVVIREDWDLPVEPVRVRNLGGVLGVEFTNNLLLWHNRVLKRALDLVLGALWLLCALPIIGLSAVALKLQSRGPIFFCQEREGFNGKSFRVWKLRTMYVDAEQRLTEHFAANPELRHEWETHFKLAHDPRLIPGIGTLLRRWSLDELPQLWNIVKGDMSLVGPRPFPEYHLQQFPEDFRELRRRVRPGLTGMWQVTVRSSGGVEEQRVFDSYYIRNWSIWIDLHILARTVFAVLGGRGAY